MAGESARLMPARFVRAAQPEPEEAVVPGGHASIAATGGTIVGIAGAWRFSCFSIQAKTTSISRRPVPAKVSVPARMLFVTMGHGTQHRAA